MFFLTVPILLFVYTDAYNLDTLDPVVLNGPRTGAHFGYSAAIQKQGDVGWVLVGAPTSNITLRDGSLGAEWGAVYNCSRGAGDEYGCVQVRLDDELPGEEEVKKGQWAGVSLAADPKSFNAITCAHRYTVRGVMNTRNEVGMRGRCWHINSQSATVSEIPDICRDNGKMAQNSDRCNAGISTSYNKDIAAVGGEGYSAWKGRAMFYNSSSDSLIDPTVIVHGSNPARSYDYFGYSMAACYDATKRTKYIFVGAPRANSNKGKVDYTKIVDGYGIKGTYPLARGVYFGSYFGAAVACGYTKPGTIQVFTGAPYWFDGKIAGDYDRGIVIGYEMNIAIGRPSFPRLFLYGKNPGDKFGAALSVIGDINKDGYEDLAVGAPADLHKNSGRVYIYLGSEKGLTVSSHPSQVLSALVTPTVPLYGFGSSVSSGADIDSNGYPDVVIGAFYSDKAFIYRTLPIVNIDVSNEVPELVDKNDTCVPSGVACFNLTFCAEYRVDRESKRMGDNTFSLVMRNSLDIENEFGQRVQFQDGSYSENGTIFRDIKYGLYSPKKCGSITVYLERVISNIKQLISIKTEVAVLPSPVFENRLALNVSQSSYAISMVKIKTSCGNATCLTDLKLSSSPMQFDKSEEGIKSDVIYSGYHDLVWSNYTIRRNTSLGKPFGSHLIVTMPQTMYIATVKDVEGKRLSICTPYSSREGVYYCALDNKLDNNATIEFNITIEYSVTGVKDTREVIIRTELKTEGSEDVHPDTNILQQTIPVRRLSRLELRGTSSPFLSLFQISAEDRRAVEHAGDIGSLVETTFLPVNYGPGYLENLNLVMEIPILLNSTGQDFLYPYKVDSSVEIDCEKDLLNTHNIPSGSGTRRTRSASPTSALPSIGSDLGDVTWACGSDLHCINISCSIGRLSKDIIGIRLTSYVWERSLPDPVSINVSVRVWVVNQDPYADLTPTSLAGPIRVPLQVVAVAEIVNTVSIWILVGASTGGLVVLALVVALLYKAGFFKRNRPPKPEFYTENKVAVLEVQDDAVQPYSSDEEEDETQFGFRNPLCEEADLAGNL